MSEELSLPDYLVSHFPLKHQQYACVHAKPKLLFHIQNSDSVGFSKGAPFSRLHVFLSSFFFTANMEYLSVCNATHNAVCKCKAGYECKAKPCVQCLPIPSGTIATTLARTTLTSTGRTLPAPISQQRRCAVVFWEGRKILGKTPK